MKKVFNLSQIAVTVKKVKVTEVIIIIIIVPQLPVKKTRQTEEEVGRHQGMDRLRVCQVPEGSEEPGKMEETG